MNVLQNRSSCIPAARIRNASARKWPSLRSNVGLHVSSLYLSMERPSSGMNTCINAKDPIRRSLKSEKAAQLASGQTLSVAYDVGKNIEARAPLFAISDARTT
nr:hypothetical protein CFP56_25919 [Quercus suber]